MRRSQSTCFIAPSRSSLFWRVSIWSSGSRQRCFRPSITSQLACGSLITMPQVLVSSHLLSGLPWTSPCYSWNAGGAVRRSLPYFLTVLIPSLCGGAASDSVRLMSIDPTIASQWGLTALKWLREIPETVKSWGQSRPRYPAVSIVPVRHPMYSESTQPDGTIVTQIVLDCIVTNGREDRSLLIARAECHVRWCGTVQGLPIVEEIIEALGRNALHLPFFASPQQSSRLHCDPNRSVWAQAQAVD